MTTSDALTNPLETSEDNLTLKTGTDTTSSLGERTRDDASSDVPEVQSESTLVSSSSREITEHPEVICLTVGEEHSNGSASKILMATADGTDNINQGHIEMPNDKQGSPGGSSGTSILNSIGNGMHLDARTQGDLVENGSCGGTMVLSEEQSAVRIQAGLTDIVVYCLVTLDGHF